MIARRDILKLAAALAGAGAAPFAVTPEQAAAILADPLAFDPGGERDNVWAADTADPFQFAEAIDGVDFRFGQLFEHGDPVAMAAYKRAHLALIDLAPGLFADRTPGGDALDAMDEAALALWCAAWCGGIRAGVAYEHLRQAVSCATMACEPCHGNGRLWGGTPYRSHGGEEATSPDCAGAGTVPTPAPRLHLGDDAATKEG